MKLVALTLFFLHISTIKSNILNNIGENILSLLNKANETRENKQGKHTKTRYFRPNDFVGNILGSISGKSYNRRFDDRQSDERDVSSAKQTAQLGISNEEIERRVLKDPVYRRFLRQDLTRNWIVSQSIGITSSSADEKAFRHEYKVRWNSRKKDALVDPIANQSRGHVVNMVAARPWNAPCGDINQHDLAVGTCTLPYECPPELRIFRGDYHCSRSSFICCAAQMHDQNMYEGFDVTMSDTSQFSTSSEDIRIGKRGSRENKRRRRVRKRNKTLKARYRRKRTIKRTIRKLAKEVRKELNRAFRNSSENRRHVIRQLKIAIKQFKKDFKLQRNLKKLSHDQALANINTNLMNKLKRIRGLNFNFLTNDTFRHIIINGSSFGRIGQDGPTLFNAYPELNAGYLDLHDGVLRNPSRRAGGGSMGERKRNNRVKKAKDYLEYDIEFGMLS